MKIVAVCCLLVLGLLTPARAADPMEAVREPVNEIISILNNPEYKANPELQEQKLWEVASEVFDFTETAKRALARNWLDFTPVQRKEFTDAFSRLLANTYINRVQQEYEDEKIVFLEAETISDDKAVVESKIIRKGTEIPVNYRLLLENGRWRVYDVMVEDVSLVKNYRTQFDKFLFNKSPAQLIDRVKEKAAQGGGEDLNEQASP